MRTVLIRALLILSLALAGGSAGAEDMPRLERGGDGVVRLMVDGKPFLFLGAQIHNSSASSSDDLRQALDSVARINATLAEIPISWEALEPEPGVYDFSGVDQAVEESRRRGLRVILLWFGTYKNGLSDYAPDWMKRDKLRFPRVIGSHGEETETISPLCDAALEADRHAFAALMGHVKQIDGARRTVLMVQVENEPGLMKTDRDYGADATALFQSAVPAELTGWLAAHRDGLSATLAEAWRRQGWRQSGTWPELFGDLAAEAFSAWTVARYVDRVAEAGKAVYAVPFYSNAWLADGWERAGKWPSGGATEHVLDIWKAAAPAIDLLAPDMYYQRFYDVAAGYARPDNPLLVPEASFEPYFVGFAYGALGAFNALGFSPFGVDRVARNGAKDEGYEAAFAAFADSYRVLRPLLPLISRYQGSGRLHPILQGTGRGEDWSPVIPLAHRRAAVIEFTSDYGMDKERASGMLIELADDDLLIVGKGFKVTLRELDGPIRDVALVSIEEGSFKEQNWQRLRRYNGDERKLVLPDKATAIRVIAAPP